MIEERHRQFLLSKGANRVKHSGRDLYSHLCGTHALLEAWGNQKTVCDGGLFHSVYGTRQFRHSSTNDREAVRAVIGPEAERLAYLFSATERPRALMQAFAMGTTKLHSFRTGETLVVSPLELQQLLEIEAANLLEQRSTGIWIRRLPACNISNGAKVAIIQYLLEGWDHAQTGAGPGADVVAAREGRLADAG